jgi:hypothetical protein
MGSRTNFEIKDERGSVWLYSHWGGDSKAQDLANAIAMAKPRWDDTPYGVRIVVSQLIGKNWDSETGYGLSTYESGEESYDPVSVDFTSKIVSYQGIDYTFENFVETFAKHLTRV